MGAVQSIVAAIILVAGITLGWLAGGLYANTVSLPAAREAGRVEERHVHEERRRRAEARAEVERQARQAEIDAIERHYHQRAAMDAARVSALEAAIEQETPRVPIPSAADRGNDACRPAVPRRLRDALDPLGRAEARDDPASVAPALR